MKLTVIYSPHAKKDLTAVWKGVFEASRDFDTADRYLDELMDTVMMKSDFPYSGKPLLYRGLFTGFYSVNFKAYKVFFRILEDNIEVIRILPLKMNYMRILFPED